MRYEKADIRPGMFLTGGDCPAVVKKSAPPRYGQQFEPSVSLSDIRQRIADAAQRAELLARQVRDARTR